MTTYQALHTSDAIYPFRLYPETTDFSRIGGLYCFLIVPEESSFYSLLYIGITNNLDRRMKNHHKIGDARGLGLTHIGVLKIRSGRRRKVIEKDLLRSLHPPLNDTHQ